MDFLGHFWSAVLVHILDVLFLTFVFYRVLLLIRGTQTVPVVVGLAIVMLTTLLARNVLHMPATTWLLENFWAVAVVILAVVFQPELRTALAQLGRHPLGRLITRELAFVDEIVEAVREGAEKQIGMLMVIEQDVGLRNYAETGTIIDGEVTKELLLTLFHYRSPLHDGAVMIRNARLLAAGCLLPLSNDPGLAKILGTRHRAAVGLSEFTDAWVIVVSEETGAVSLAREGALERNLSVEELRDKLTELFRAREMKSLGSMAETRS